MSIPRLVAVNVGLPQDVPWRGRTVHTGVFKYPVDGPQMVRTLNIDGDGQGDLGGHGGPHRAVMVYQLDSYEHWRAELGRDDLGYGQFGENFTVDGLPDDEVCIGDRLQIGDALFEVSQPRVTCYRVGMRMKEPRLPALLVSHHRPGFYLRVLREGVVQAGDEIAWEQTGPERMTVAEVDALLYLPGHDRAALARARRLPALSPGWQGSFEAMLDSGDATGNVGLTDAAAAPPVAWPGFRPMRVVDVEPESDSVRSLRLASIDGTALPAALPGQFVAVRIAVDADGTVATRSYSLSGPIGAPDYRVSVKRETHGLVSGFVYGRLRAEAIVDVAAPRGGFVLRDGGSPVLLISAGIGATPVLAMLHALADGGSRREIWWLHGARNSAEHPFAAEVRDLLARLPHARAEICYSAPLPTDQIGHDYTRRGHLAADVLQRLGHSDGRAGVRLRAAALHGRHPFVLDRSRAGRRSDRHRGLRRRSRDHPGHRRGTGRPAAPAAGRPGQRTGDLLRPQRSHRELAGRCRQPAGIRRGLRCADPLVLPHRDLSYLRDRAARRVGDL